jgi:hypothetical protein
VRVSERASDRLCVRVRILCAVQCLPVVATVHARLTKCERVRPHVCVQFPSAAACVGYAPSRRYP